MIKLNERSPAGSFDTVLSDVGGNSGTLGATFNFINSIIGAGLIGLPYAVKESGLVLGVLCLVLVTVFTYISVVTMVTCGQAVKVTGYENLLRTCFGSKGFLCVLLAMCFQGFGAMCVYLIIIGDTVTPVMNSFFAINLTRQFYITLCSFLTILPLALVKDMATLKWSSFVSILAAVVIVLLVFFKAPSHAEAQSIEAEFTVAKLTVFSGLGTMSFAFVCQHSTFLVFNTMRNNTLSGWRLVALLSLCASFLISLSLSLAGYLNFYEETKPNILNNFTQNDGVLDFARLLLALTMMLTYPMENFVVRHCMNYFELHFLHSMEASEDYEEFVQTHAAQRHYLYSFGIFGLSLAIGLAVDDLGFVFELIGAIGGSALGYIFPAMCYIKLHRRGVVAENQMLLTLNRLMLVFGVFALVLGAFQAVQKKLGPSVP